VAPGCSRRNRGSLPVNRVEQSSGGVVTITFGNALGSHVVTFESISDVEATSDGSKTTFHVEPLLPPPSGRPAPPARNAQPSRQRT
jgi:hypothetical protein